MDAAYGFRIQPASVERSQRKGRSQQNTGEDVIASYSIVFWRSSWASIAPRACHPTQKNMSQSR
jgi:hypothetical protein